MALISILIMRSDEDPDEAVAADALATACLVMGTSQALELIESISGYEAYLVERHADGSFHATRSSGFHRDQ